MQSLPFSFECPAVFFEKAEAPQGQRRRIAGVISTENRDRQKEIVLQKGLDFSEFINHGWYNDNHSKETDGIVGYPELVKQFQKGAKLPDGSLAPANLTWAEGYLLEGHQRSDKLWELGCALQKSGAPRRLGYSIEGGIEKRDGPSKLVIAKARVRNVAITNCPVNTDSRLEVIAKSLMAVSEAEDELLDRVTKSLTVGTTQPGFNPAIKPVGPHTGSGAGRILTTQSLESKQHKMAFDSSDEDEEERKRKKKLNKAEAILWLYERLPHVSAATLGRIVDTTIALKRQGKL